jgi:hypothetical protein
MKTAKPSDKLQMILDAANSIKPTSLFEAQHGRSGKLKYPHLLLN